MKEIKVIGFCLKNNPKKAGVIFTRNMVQNESAFVNSNEKIIYSWIIDDKLPSEFPVGCRLMKENL